jgi:hypothetical protein
MLNLTQLEIDWKQVHPYVRDALRFLEATQEGQQVRAQLFANVFTVEHAVDGDEATPGLAASGA